MFENHPELICHVSPKQSIAIKSDEGCWDGLKVADRNIAEVGESRDFGSIGQMPDGFPNRRDGRRNETWRYGQPSVETCVYQRLNVKLEVRVILIPEPNADGQIRKPETRDSLTHRILPRATSPTLKM